MPGVCRSARGTILHVSNSEAPGWPDYLQTAMKDRGVANAAALSHDTGIDQTQISRWLRGIGQPSIENLRRLAPALRRPLLELMVEAGHVTREEARLRDAPAAVPRAQLIGVAEAIKSDTELLEEARNHLLNQYDLLRRLSGQGDKKGAGRPLRAVARKRPRRSEEPG
jgi:transcriptional regulator with XRE-family HTH domain